MLVGERYGFADGTVCPYKSEFDQIGLRSTLLRSLVLVSIDLIMHSVWLRRLLPWLPEFLGVVVGFQAVAFQLVEFRLRLGSHLFDVVRSLFERYRTVLVCCSMWIRYLGRIGLLGERLFPSRMLLTASDRTLDVPFRFARWLLGVIIAVVVRWLSVHFFLAC